MKDYKVTICDRGVGEAKEICVSGYDAYVMAGDLFIHSDDGGCIAAVFSAGSWVRVIQKETEGNRNASV